MQHPVLLQLRHNNEAQGRTGRRYFVIEHAHFVLNHVQAVLDPIRIDEGDGTVVSELRGKDHYYGELIKGMDAMDTHAFLQMCVECGERVHVGMSNVVIESMVVVTDNPADSFSFEVCVRMLCMSCRYGEKSSQHHEPHDECVYTNTIDVIWTLVMKWFYENTTNRIKGQGAPFLPLVQAYEVLKPQWGFECQHCFSTFERNQEEDEGVQLFPAEILVTSRDVEHVTPETFGRILQVFPYPFCDSECFSNAEEARKEQQKKKAYRGHSINVCFRIIATDRNALPLYDVLFADTDRVCAVCDKPLEHPKMCARCRFTHYCGKECQVVDYRQRNHFGRCKHWREDTWTEGRIRAFEQRGACYATQTLFPTHYVSLCE